MQRNPYKQNLALANCTYINIFFFFTITFNFFFSHKAFCDLIYYIQFFVILFKKVPFRFTAYASKAKVKTSCPKGKPGKKEAVI